MSDREEQWLDAYMETGNAQEAVRIAFDCSEASVPSRASQLKRKLSNQIHQKLTASFIPGSVAAFKIIQDLMFNCTQPSVQLKAAIYLTEVAGYKPVNKEMVVTQDFDPKQAKVELESIRKRLLLETPKEELEEALQGMH